MNIDIIDQNLSLVISGFSGIAENRDYTGIAFKLMSKMWEVVKANNVNNKGLNILVYEENEKVFAGVELTGSTPQNTGLEQKNISLTKYAYFKHTGSYKLIREVGQNMRDELAGKGFQITFPYIEIYGHWVKEESELETELIMSIK